MSTALYAAFTAIAGLSIYLLRTFPVAVGTLIIGGDAVIPALVGIMVVLLLGVVGAALLSSRWNATTQRTAAYVASALFAAWNCFLVLFAGVLIAWGVIGGLQTAAARATIGAAGSPTVELSAALLAAAIVPGLIITAIANIAPRFGRPWLVKKWLQWQYAGRLDARPHGVGRYAYTAVHLDTGPLESGQVDGWGFEATAARVLQLGKYQASDALADFKLTIGPKAGQPFTLVVASIGPLSSPLTSFVGDVEITSSDPAAPLGITDHFTAADHGVRSIDLTLPTPGTWVLKVRDLAGGTEASREVIVTS
jgi:hypothetical protein